MSSIVCYCISTLLAFVYCLLWPSSSMSVLVPLFYHRQMQWKREREREREIECLSVLQKQQSSKRICMSNVAAAMMRGESRERDVTKCHFGLQWSPLVLPPPPHLHDVNTWRALMTPHKLIVSKQSYWLSTFGWNNLGTPSVHNFFATKWHCLWRHCGRSGRFWHQMAQVWIQYTSILIVHNFSNNLCLELVSI